MVIVVMVPMVNIKLDGMHRDKATALTTAAFVFLIVAGYPTRITSSFPSFGSPLVIRERD
jgi:hypothetical protein